MGIDYAERAIPYSYYDGTEFVDSTMRHWSISKWVETAEDKRGPAIRPIGDTIAWAWDPTDDQSGSLILTDSEVHGRIEMTAVGVVVAVGKGIWIDYEVDGKQHSRFQKPELKVGDRIFGLRMVGVGLRSDTDRLRFGKERLIPGIIED